MRLAHCEAPLSKLRQPSVEDPLRMIVSGCLAAWPCGVNGTDYGLGAPLKTMLSLPTVSVASFCPEQFAMGTPRTMPDIHGGDGYDVLDGRAKVYDEHNHDLTEKMVAGAYAMLECAQKHRAELALLTDMSAACGSQVISKGCRLVEHREFTASVGVATALLLRNQIAVVSQRDYKTLNLIKRLLDPQEPPAPEAFDYHETPWYLATFGSTK